MKFGVVRYSKERELPHRNKIAARFLTYYIENFRPYQLSDTELWGVPGVEVRLQTTAAQAEAKGVLWQKKLEEALQELYDQEAVIVIAPPEGAFPGQLIRVARGRDLAGLFIMDIVKKAAKSLSLDLKDARVVIIDGKNRYSALALDMICPHVNFLSVYTDRKEDFSQQAEEIYEDCGLNLQLFSNSKGSLMAEGDIVINCGYDMENYDYTFKKGAFYFDLAQNKPKLLRLCVRREDLLLADGCTVRRDKDFLKDVQAEAVYYVTNDPFRRYICGRYDGWIAAEAETALRETGLALGYLTCMGKAIRKK